MMREDVDRAELGSRGGFDLSGFVDLVDECLCLLFRQRLAQCLEKERVQGLWGRKWGCEGGGGARLPWGLGLQKAKILRGGGTFIAARSSSTSIAPEPSESKVSKTSLISMIWFVGNRSVQSRWVLDQVREKTFLAEDTGSRGLRRGRVANGFFSLARTCSSVMPILAFLMRVLSSSAMFVEEKYIYIYIYIFKRGNPGGIKLVGAKFLKNVW